MGLVVTSNAISPTLNITGSHEISNNHSLDTVQMTFLLTAKDSKCPMPEGTVDGVKKVTIPAGNKFEFGNIVYDKPGQYVYTVSREIIPTDNLEQDDRVYTIYVSVFSDGELTCVYSEEGVQAKPDELKYIDKYKSTPTDEDVPDEPEVIDDSDNTTNHAVTTSSNSSNGSSDSGSSVIRNFFQTGDMLTYIIMGGFLFVIALVSLVIYRRRR